MFCRHCNAQLPVKAQVCCFCGEEVPPTALQKSHRKTVRKLHVPTLLASPRFVRAITCSTYGCDALKEAQEQVTSLIAHARSGTVTYETVFCALRIDRDHDNRFVEELGIFYDAYDAFTEYCDLLTEVHDETTLFSQFHMLRIGNVCKALDMLGMDTPQIHPYPGLKRWLAGCLLTSVLMSILNAGCFENISPKDLRTVDIAYGEDFWQEQLILAKKATLYVLPHRTNQEAIESFIHQHQSLVTTVQKEQLRLAFLRQLASLLRSHHLTFAEAATVSHFALAKIASLTKEYELILLVDLILAKWSTLADIQLLS